LLPLILFHLFSKKFLLNNLLIFLKLLHTQYGILTNASYKFLKSYYRHILYLIYLTELGVNYLNKLSIRHDLIRNDSILYLNTLLIYFYLLYDYLHHNNVIDL
jgi:hypothetical protein